MASLDFSHELEEFKKFYDENYQYHYDALRSMHSLLESLALSDSRLGIEKIEYRLKVRDECVGKFIRNYRGKLEKEKKGYSIKNHVSDILGLRITCQYEEDIAKVQNLIDQNFFVLETTDKTAELVADEGRFGYKGLHMDLCISEERAKFPEYYRYKGLRFEVQIRTLIQDAWSVLDHKLKYKKSIPNDLKRRVNALAALFEIADREFSAIRDLTGEYEERAEDYEVDISETEGLNAETKLEEGSGESGEKGKPAPILDAFSFLRIANHFFEGYEFPPDAADDFVEEILQMRPETTRGKFNYYLRTSISLVKRYAEERLTKAHVNMKPFTIMRHCLFYHDDKKFRTMLTPQARQYFNAYLLEAKNSAR
ncbi:GTP pyrophosphokinase YwaC [Jannaschia aquimarina]|uniref:YwaC protein n=1 Tax=Jannaschia aquimarina TaxID=935700 RepID=A0A0D1EQV1_9RHOB|nr:GTP pyrophosphokinase YwaC [Jannaschia aquimarina]SNS88678.1 ppGpp synthetase catalytic domain-containing protein (RelA/SpoT-type nucleotidyltranferase) [Jannaschia aquimarina]